MLGFVQGASAFFSGVNFLLALVISFSSIFLLPAFISGQSKTKIPP
jgi:hypothetical protein